MTLWITILRNSLFMIWFNAWSLKVLYQHTETIFGLLDTQIPNRICLFNRPHSLNHSEKQKRNPSKFWFFWYTGHWECYTVLTTSSNENCSIHPKKTAESYKIKTGLYPKEFYFMELRFSKQQMYPSSSEERMNTRSQCLKMDGALVVVHVTWAPIRTKNCMTRSEWVTIKWELH